jgi:hypothetical protein
MIIFSASLPGIGLLPDRAVLCIRFLYGMAACRMRSTIPVHSAPAHNCEWAADLADVVNDLL